ncbi:S-layer homology domain-containing protein [Niallia endozanthoxylica]|uniref:S-layer homology domain-containing protein n=1 Tax=Niallia endozanthoxylica TaxID=2036016 RepID=A0A5J5H7Y0_9BACI|nr:S-layer homology domain-containing protein [Niallia endozanthoxylica]KAA9015514.1 S-layer homology domain-containing protein [Niallia endozanthoxylica]
MIKRLKLYRKIIAGILTAAIVAVSATGFAAGFKDVSASYKEAVDFLVSKGIKGLSETTFGTYENIKRVDAAVMVANVLDLDVDEAPDAGFTDVPQRAVKQVNALKAVGITDGKTETTFASQQPITRGELAIWLQRGFDLEADIGELAFTDVADRYERAVSALVAARITNGTTETTFGTHNNAKRGDFAKFLLRADQAVVPLSIESISAVNANTLKITGVGLKQLKIEDISVENNTVMDISSSADGKHAIVKLSSELLIDQTAKVTVQEVSFDVTYKLELDTVTVDEAAYDDDTVGQFVAIKVNGTKATAQELILAGYIVQFEAFSNKSATKNVTNDLFESNSTGKLNTNLFIPVSGQEFYVRVKVIKGAEVIISELTEIKIKNLDLVVDSITAAKLVNLTTTFKQNSTMLMTGEKAQFTDVTVKSGSDEDVVTGGFTVKSSDVSVVSVMKDENGNEVLTAQGPGTATITVTYGGAILTKTFTVTNGEREATTIDTEKTELIVVKNGEKTTKVTLLDQYGDPMAITSGVNVALVVINNEKVNASLSHSSGEDGEAVLKVEGKDTGSATIIFRDAANVKIGTTLVKVSVTENGTLSKYELEVDTTISDSDVTKVNEAIHATIARDKISTDAILDAKGDKFLKIDLRAFNSDGVELAKPEVSNYTVETYVSNVGVLAATSYYAGKGYIVVEAGNKAGRATIIVRNKDNGNILATLDMIVEKVGYEVVEAELKNVETAIYAQTLNYEDFLSYIESANDPVISGIKLTKSVTQPVRLDIKNNTGTVGALYVDKNADGSFVATDGDFEVGRVVMTIIGEIADHDFDAIVGVDVAAGDHGTILFKVLDTEDRVIANKAVTVEV